MAVRCSLGHSCGLDLVLLLLRYRMAAAALIQPLARELLSAMGVALKAKKKKKKARAHLTPEFMEVNRSDLKCSHPHPLSGSLFF